MEIDDSDNNNNNHNSASSNAVLLQSIASFLPHLLSESPIQQRMVLFDADVCRLSLDDLIDFIDTLFVIFTIHHKNTNNTLHKCWITIWEQCLLKLKHTHLYIIKHWDSLRIKDKQMCASDGYDYLFQLCIKRYFYPLCHLHCMMEEDSLIKTLIMDIISLALFDQKHVHRFEHTLSSTEWFAGLLKTMLIHKQIENDTDVSTFVSYPAHKKRKLSDLSKLDIFDHPHKKDKTDCILLLFEAIEAICKGDYLQKHISDVVDRCAVFKELSLGDWIESITTPSVLQMISKEVYIAFIRSWRESIRQLDTKQRTTDKGLSTEAPLSELRQKYPFQLEYCFGYELLQRLKSVDMDSGALLFLESAKATDQVFEIMYQENIYRPNLDHYKYQMNELSDQFKSILQQLQHRMKSKTMDEMDDETETEKDHVMEGLLHRIHGLCRLNYAVIHKHIESLIICLFDETLADYDGIIEQIIAQIFQKYGSVYEVPLLLDAIIHLYVSKTGQIQWLRENVHNFIVCNMVQQCWTKRALSASQAVHVWKSFLSAFEWIYSVQSDTKWIGFRAFCDCPWIWNLMAHFLNYVLIDEFNSKTCLALIDQVRPFVKDLIDLLLFKELFDILSIRTVSFADTDEPNTSKQRAIKRSSSVKNGLDELSQHIDDSVQMKHKLESNITDVRLGIDRCQYQINEYFDGWMNKMHQRKEALLDSLKQFEKVRMNPLYKQLEDMDRVLDSYQDTKHQVMKQLMMSTQLQQDNDDASDTEMMQGDDERDVLNNISRTLSTSHRVPKLSTIPCFEHDADIEKQFESISAYGDIYQQRVHSNKWIKKRNALFAMDEDELDALKQQRERMRQQRLGLLHDLIYIECTLNKIHDECQTFDDTIQVQLHPQLPTLFCKLHDGKEEKYQLIWLVRKMEAMNTVMDSNVMHCVHGLEYCALHRIIQLFDHHIAFGMDCSSAVMQKEEEELQYFVEWMVPKLISKEKDTDRLWTEIHSIHSEHQMNIYKAISIYCTKKTFIQWFKFLLTNHYKMNAAERSDHRMQVDVLNELWFYDVAHVESIITSEIIHIFHGDLNHLLEDVHYKSCKHWLQEIDDAVYKLSLSQFNFDEITSNIMNLNQKSKEIMLETIAPNVPRWCFLCDFIRSIPRQSKTKTNKVFCLCLIFDLMLIRPLMSLLDDDEDEDEDMDALKRFIDALYSMFEHIIPLQLQESTLKKISIADLIQLPAAGTAPKQMEKAMIELLYCAEQHLLSTFEQPKLEPFGYERRIVTDNEWNKITKKTSVEGSALHYSLRTLQSKKRRSFTTLEKLIITNCQNEAHNQWNVKLLRCLMSAHAQYIQSLSDFIERIGFRFDLDESHVELWKNKQCQLYVAPQSLMLMKDALHIVMSNEMDMTDMCHILKSICVILHIARQSVTVHHQINEEYAWSDWNESFEARVHVVLKWIQNARVIKLQYAQFVGCLARCAVSLNKVNHTKIYEQITDIALSLLPIHGALSKHYNGPICRILIDCVIICCSKSKQITEYIFNKVETELKSSTDGRILWSLLKIFESIYKNTETIYRGAKLKLDWFDAIHSKILQKYGAICGLQINELSFALMDCLNALICEQSIITLTKKQLSVVIACISKVITTANVSLSLYNKVSQILINIMFNYKSFVRDISAHFYLLLRKMIGIALDHIQKNENVLFIEECSRMLCILMRKPKKEEEDKEGRSKQLHMATLLQNKHVLIVHCDQLLLQFVEFINEFPIQNVQKRILMPAIYLIIDCLMFSNLMETGNCMDQILFALPHKLKPTLKDIYSSYHNSKSAGASQTLTHI
eukprot:484433_1